MKKKKIVPFIVFGVLIAALAVSFAVLKLTAPGEEKKEAPTLLSGEYLGEDDPGESMTEQGSYLLIFPKRDRSAIRSILVHNENGEYTLVKNGDETFSLAGLPGAPLSDERVAAVVVAAGYTLTRERVVDRATPEEKKEYGLDDPKAWWVLTDVKGREYRVNVGDRMVSGDGYYCSFAGRDAVYVLGTSLETSVLEPCEYFVTAALTAGITQENYFNIEEFAILHGEDVFVAVTAVDPEEKQNPDAIVEAKLAYPQGSRANDSLYINAIGTFVNMAGDETAAIATSDDDYVKFGLEKPAYEVHFALDGTDWDFFFSDVTEDGYIYGVSSLLDYRLIARFEESALSWLKADLFRWVADYPMSVFITTLDEIRVKTGERDVTFRLTHGTDENGNATLSAASDVVSFDNDGIYNFRQFYKTVIASKLKGTSSLSEEERKAAASDPEKLIFSVEFTRKNGSKTEYGFFRTTTREALFTVNGEGEFYINVDWPEKLASDLERLIAGLDIDSYGKD